jgi:hypothetical protein
MVRSRRRAINRSIDAAATARFADDVDEEETAFAELAAKTKTEDTLINRALRWIDKLTCVRCVVESATGVPLERIRPELPIMFFGAGATRRCPLISDSRFGMCGSPDAPHRYCVSRHTSL